LADEVWFDFELIRAICNRECILFVGSGLSAAVQNKRTLKNLPTWADLLKNMLDTLKSKGQCDLNSAKQIEDLINDKKILIAAQELKEQLSKQNLLKGFLLDTFDSSQLSPHPNHKRIAQIHFRAILTTNYDTLIEDGFRQSGEPFISLDKNSLTSSQLPLRPNDPKFIFRLHGCYSDPNDIILGTRDYQDVMFNAPGYRQLIETLFSVYTVLFIGFGGDDPNLGSILDQLATFYGRQLHDHYILLPKGRMDSLERERLQKDRRVRVIEYGNSQQDHVMVKVLLEFLLWLGDCSKMPQSIFTDTDRRRLKIFISYGASVNIRLLSLLKDVLREEGYQVWTIQESSAFIQDTSSEGIPLEARRQLNVEWALALSEADAIIFLVQGDLSEQRNQINEILYAQFWSQRRKLSQIMVSIDDTPIPEHLKGGYIVRVRTPSAYDDFHRLIGILEQINIELRGENEMSLFASEALDTRLWRLLSNWKWQHVPSELFGAEGDEISFRFNSELNRNPADPFTFQVVLGLEVSDGLRFLYWEVRIWPDWGTLTALDQDTFERMVQEIFESNEIDVVWLVVGESDGPIEELRRIAAQNQPEGKHFYVSNLSHIEALERILEI
jgi:hypothetical protein